ncbi:hypothetical protein VMCG_03577 [Cytospora schulzeri]|uniref:Rhodopsin domain-containing protein n=1 Tax=Cytospora schulzeri TaxID=448051 RepID=A0A423WW25_9PEZI|nr:hypothetical protein VMCG_03577 [Valsa malicola]
MAATKPFSEMEPTWLTDPDELGKGTLAVTITLGVLSILLVMLRSWTRVQTGTFALDDGLMVIGLFVFIACCVSTSMAVYAGLGTRDENLPPWNRQAGIMYLIFFEITYAWSLPFIKSSICLTMLRIITERKFRIILWVSMGASVATAMIGFAAVVALCNPIEEYWDPSVGGWCAPIDIITGISYLISAMSVITDWTCSLLPCVVVWNLQMQPRLKASVCGVLALGMVASAATIVRLPYLQYYNVPTDYLCTFYMPRGIFKILSRIKSLTQKLADNVGNIVVWSIVECGIGIICGSLPSLRTLFKSWLDKSVRGDTYDNSSYRMGKSGGGGNGEHGGSIKMGYLSSKGAAYSAKISAPTRTQGEWEELDGDTESEKRMITRTVEISVDVNDDSLEAGSSRH